MNCLKMCFNPKVLAVLATAGLGLFLFAPNLALSALPVLLGLACPLSMVAAAALVAREIGRASCRERV